MRHFRVTGMIGVALAVLWPGWTALAQENEAIDLQGGVTGTAPAAVSSDTTDESGEHPVYDLRPEPYSDADALLITLQEVLELAVANNLGLAQQNYTIEKGHYTVDQTYYAFDPQVSGSLSYSWSDVSSAATGGVASGESHRVSTGIKYSKPREYGDSFQISYDLGVTAAESINPGYSTALSLSYQRPLAQGAGKYVNRIPRYMASNNLLLSYDRLDDEVRNLKKRVMDTYFQAVAAREAIAVREASLDVSLQQLERIVERYKVGLAIRIDLLQAENSVLTQRAQLLDARTNYADILDSLTVLVGLPQEFALAVDSDNALLDVAAELPEDLWLLVQANSFDLKSLNTQLANLRLQRDQQLHQLKPDLNLGLSYGRSASGGELDPVLADTSSQNLGLNLSWSATPGQRSARAGMAQTELDLASLDLAIQDTELQLKTNLRAQQRSLETLRQQVDIAQSNLEVLQETYNFQKERDAVGLATTLDVVEAQEKVLSAELAILNARVAYHQAYREVLLSAGLI